VETTIENIFVSFFISIKEIPPKMSEWIFFLFLSFFLEENKSSLFYKIP